MKFGFDLHGVIDSRPEFFSKLTNLLVESGHEVHVLTGPSITDELRIELANLYQIHWTHLFSIVDSLREQKIPMWQDPQGMWWSDPYQWDKAKGEYCSSHQIDLHFDDSDHYQYFFTTPYCRFLSRDSNRVKKTMIPKEPVCGGPLAVV